MATEKTIEGTPSALPTMLKAALPMIPGVNMLPGIAKKGGALPDLVLHRKGVAIEADKVAAYAKVCGYDDTAKVPFLFPHMLAFPLHMAIMTDSSFPFPAVGSVHLYNGVTRHRPLSVGEKLDITVTATNLRKHPRGNIFDMVATASVGDELVWESTSTYLSFGKGDKEATPDWEAFEVVPGSGQVWKLPANLGRRYGAVSGDMNPIHLYPLTAKALGFPRQIAHGMWNMARCIATFESRLADHATVEVEFKKPVLLPGKEAFGSRVVEGGLDFAVTSPKNGAPHMLGRARDN